MAAPKCVSAWQKRNPEKCREYQKRWRENHREQDKENHKKWRENNPEKVKAYYVKKNSNRNREDQRKYLAKKNGVPYEKINEDEIFERDWGVCQMCHDAVDRNLKYPDPLSLTLHHKIPMSKGGGHTKDNIELAHLICSVNHVLYTKYRNRKGTEPT